MPTIKYSTKKEGNQELLEVEITGNQEKRNEIRESLVDHVAEHWQFLSYIDFGSQDKGIVTFNLRSQGGAL